MFISVYRSLNGVRSKRHYSNKDKLLSLIVLSLFYLQIIAGVILYTSSHSVRHFLSDPAQMMKDASSRFWGIEHVGLMLLSAILITLGYLLAKSSATDRSKFVKTFWFYAIGTILVLSAIPWPFREALGRTWLPF